MHTTWDQEEGHALGGEDLKAHPTAKSSKRDFWGDENMDGQLNRDFATKNGLKQEDVW